MKKACFRSLFLASSLFFSMNASLARAQEPQSPPDAPKPFCRELKPKLLGSLEEPKAKTPQLKKGSWSNVLAIGEEYIALLHTPLAKPTDLKKEVSIKELEELTHDQVARLDCLTDAQNFFRAIANTYGPAKESPEKKEARNLYLKWLQAPLEIPAALPLAVRLSNASLALETGLVATSTEKTKSLKALQKEFRSATKPLQKESKEIFNELLDKPGLHPKAIAPAKAKAILIKEANTAEDFHKQLKTWTTSL